MAEPGSPIAVLGPGTGLGVACLVADNGKPAVVASEGGHATLAGTCKREDAIINHLRARFDHVSAERALSGPGLENLFTAIAVLDGKRVSPLSAPRITDRALAGECRVCSETLKIFCAFLGSFAGNVALTFRATGGVYIAGGISPRIVEFIGALSFEGDLKQKAVSADICSPYHRS